uniref:C-type lectin domain-containing protein n=1 Tax=Poecilia mexicana TaxID=48701 RepID=A0A3B3XKF7_9TELE
DLKHFNFFGKHVGGILTNLYLILFSTTAGLLIGKFSVFALIMFKEPPCVQCEPGWELNQMNCYYFNTNKSSWNDSRRSCADLGSDLVKIDSREEQNFWDRFWIGLTDSEEEGRWFWVDGSPLDKRFGWFGNSLVFQKTSPEIKSNFICKAHFSSQAFQRALYNIESDSDVLMSSLNS